MVYLFIGEDAPSKQIKLKEIKKQFLPSQTQEFNLDILYGRETNLKTIQEKLLFLPVQAKKRIIVVKDAQHLKQEIKEFLLAFAKNPAPQVLLILDINKRDPKDIFVNAISRGAQTFAFREAKGIDTFTLVSCIDQKKAAFALKILHQLLRNGEKPERILGGLRYAWVKNSSGPQEMKKRLTVLLNCDIDIKTGRLKPEFALEKLVIRLCGLANS